MVLDAAAVLIDALLDRLISQATLHVDGVRCGHLWLTLYEPVAERRARCGRLGCRGHSGEAIGPVVRVAR